jgi:hypothetical protein
MLNFIAKAFRFIFELGLWLSLIVFSLAGGFFGYSRGGGLSNSSSVIGGIIIGIIVGILFNVIWGGLISVFLRIDNNLKILIKTQGGKPINNGVDSSQIKTQTEET